MRNEDRTKIAEAIRSLGAGEVARRLGLSTEAVLRLALGAGSHEGTEALALQRIDRLEKEAGDAA